MRLRGSSCPISTRPIWRRLPGSLKGRRGVWGSSSRKTRTRSTTMGKKFKAAAALVEPRPYDLREAVELVKRTAFAKFDETVEMALRLGVDPKRSDQMVRGSAVLPHGTGVKVRVEDKVEKAGIRHVRVGKVSFEAEKLYENALAILDSVLKAKPSTSKGRYLKSVTLSTTMGPGVPVDTIKLSKKLAA